MTWSDFKTLAWLIAVLLMTAIGLVGVGVFGWQCFLWVRDGVWVSYDYRDIWTWFGGGDLTFEPRWLRAVANLILDAPIFSSAIAVAAAMGKAIPDLKEDVKRRRKKRAARKRSTA